MKQIQDDAGPMSAPSQFRGIVTGVLSGDSLLVKFLPPCTVPLQIVSLENVFAPRYGSNNGEKPDEPHGSEAFEFLRKTCIGQRVVIPAAGKQAERFRGHSVFGKLPVIFKRVFLCDRDNQDVGLLTTREGWTQVRGPKFRDAYVTQLKAAQKKAQEEVKGIWRPNGIIRQLPVRYDPDKLRKTKAYDALVEGVLNGTTLTLFLIPNNEYIFFQIAGCVAPSTKKDSFAEFGQESKEAMAKALLDRIIRINICDYTENKVFVGNILGRPDNAVKNLIAAGLAKFRECSAEYALTADDYLRAENIAKSKKMNLWKDYRGVPPKFTPVTIEGIATSVKNSNVVCIETESDDDDVYEVHLNCIRPPPFCSEPLGYEARDFMRRMVIGRRVTAIIEGNVEGYGSFGSVYVDGVNVAEQMCLNGFAIVASSAIQGLESRDLANYKAAMEVATKKQIGLHSKDIDPNVEFFHDHGVRLNHEFGVIESVLKGCKFMVSIPSRKVMVRVGLNGVSPNEETATEARLLCESLCHQRDIEFDVIHFDKAHIAYSNVWIIDHATGKKRYNIAHILFRKGYVVLNSSDGSVDFPPELLAPEEEEEEEEPPSPEPSPVPTFVRIAPEPLSFDAVYKVNVVNVLDPLTLLVQHHSEAMERVGSFLFSANLTDPLENDIVENQVVVNIEKGDRFRAIVDKINPDSVEITYIDWGVSAVVDRSSLFAIDDPEIASIPPQAVKVSLGCLTDPTNDIVDYVWSLCGNVILYVHLMYRDGDTDYVLLTDNGSVDGGSLNAMILHGGIAKLKICEVQPQFQQLYESWKEL